MSQDLTKKEETALVTMDFTEDAGAGFEDADSDSYAIPYLQILQSLSPQLNKRKAEYVEGANDGDFLQTVTQEVFAGEKGVILCPVYFSRLFTEWIPREQGGGFRGRHKPLSEIVLSGLRGDSGNLHLQSGNILKDTRYHYCLLITDDGPQPVLITMTSSQIKVSKQWNTKARTLRVPGKDGLPVMPPSFSHLYRAVSVQESNSKGTWNGFKISRERILDPSNKGDVIIYHAAKEFRTQVSSGATEIIAPEEPAEEVTEF